MIIVTVTFALISIFLLITYTISLRKLKTKQSEINDITKKLNDLSNKPQQREAFRVDIPLEECLFNIVKTGENSSIDNNVEKGKVRDLSFNGMKLISDVDLPVREHVVLRLKINIKEEEFELFGVVKRKEEYDLRSKIVYGIEFKHLHDEHKKALYQLLNAIEVERNNKKIE